jgi:hypothetical protein
MGHDRKEARTGSSGLRVAGAIAVAALLVGVAACSQDAPPATAGAADTAELVQVENLEAVTTEYIVANPTNVFNNHFVYDTEVVGEIDRGETVEVLGKVPGYEWLLIGEAGEPLGYVPISMLAPADLYVP